MQYLTAFLLALIFCAAGSAQEKTAAKKALDYEVLRVQWILAELVQPGAKENMELTDEQVAAAKKAFERLQRTIASYDHVDPTTAEGKLQYNELYLKIAGQGKEMEKQLIPEQMKKLNSMYYATQVRTPLCFGLTDRFVGDILNLSNEQKSKIDALAKKTQQQLDEELEEVRQKIAAVKRKHLEKALKMLSPKQRKAYLEKFWPKEDGAQDDTTVSKNQ